MTLHERLSNRPISGTEFVLATDLDGTFLGGTDEDRRRLYDWIEAHRKTIGLVFVTGRDPEFIVDMCREKGLPWPEYVIGDVGTTIAEVTPEGHVAPIEPLEEDIAARWNASGDRVRSALDGKAGLTLQPTEFRYRVSYDLDTAAFDATAVDVIRAMDLDILISDNRFFDVLPKGVSKGPSLLRLIDHLGLDQSRVLAAGDTMNDLSMLKAGVPAVAVGGSEERLLAALEGLSHVHFARPIGAAGILDAVSAFKLHPTP